MYNHGMVALFPDWSYVVVADLDEFLVTEKPMRVDQVKMRLIWGMGFICMSYIFLMYSADNDRVCFAARALH